LVFGVPCINCHIDHWKADALMDNWLNIIPLFIIAISCVVFFQTDKIVWAVSCIGIIYLAAFGMMIQSMTLGLSFVKLFTGLMALLILTFPFQKKSMMDQQKSRSEKIFRIAGITLLGLIIVLVAIPISKSIKIAPELTIGALFILACGLLQIGMTQTVLNVFLGILILFYGFAMIYSILENSLLINGFLVAVNLVLAIVGSYLLQKETESIEQ
jgi:uncharacterized protein YjeT (DUF2065 family)